MSGAPVVILAGRDDQARKRRRAVLAPEGLQLYEAASGQEVLDLAALRDPDLVILDLDLGDQDAASVCRSLKSDADSAPQVILSIPESTNRGGKQDAFRSQADGYLMEPVEPEVLSAAVLSMLRLSQTRKELLQVASRVSALEEDLRGTRAEVEKLASQTCHDVEEPLRAVTTFVQLIEERPEGRLSKDERAYLEHVIAASTRVRRMLRSFLSYSHAGRGRRERLGRIDLGIAAAAAVQSMRGLIEETGTAVRFEGTLPQVEGDFGELQGLFEQVIGNAIHYRKPGSAASITVATKPAGDQEQLITIADNGPGIPSDLQSAVFLPFKRLHGRQYPGAGMGLAIAKRIVEAHGGRIWIEAAPDGGACICFTLPAMEIGSAQAI